MKWDTIIENVYKMKEKVNNLQNEEVDKIKEKVNSFEDTLSKIRKEYKKSAYFTYDVDQNDAYNSIHKYHVILNHLDIESAKLIDLEKVFELTVSKHRQIKKCRHENKLL